jgi:hypothetical protein
MRCRLVLGETEAGVKLCFMLDPWTPGRPFQMDDENPDRRYRVDYDFTGPELLTGNRFRTEAVRRCASWLFAVLEQHDDSMIPTEGELISAYVGEHGTDPDYEVLDEQTGCWATAPRPSSPHE